MNIITFCSIERIDTGYLVRYLKGKSFHTAIYGTLLDAIDYARNQLKADRDEILLSITK